MSVSIQSSFDRIANLKIFTTLQTDGINGPILTEVGATGIASKGSVTFPSKLKDGTPGYRIKFRVDKILELTPNPVSIFIYNLGPFGRDLLDSDKEGIKGQRIVLEAGYGQSAQMIFTGNLARARTRKEGPDYITQIEAQDGLVASQSARIDISFKPAITAQQVISTLVGALKGSGISPGLQSGVPTSVYSNGITLSGNVLDRLKETCDANDLHVTIQDGEIVIAPIGGAKASPVVIVGENTGLIGVPEKRDVGVQFRCLMNPKIGVLQPIILISNFVSGLYTAAKVIHTGDSFGGEWYTEVEAS